MSKIHLEILDNQRSSVFNTLKAFKDVGYLAGGTALALQLKHRISYDFDIFTPAPLDNTLHQRINTLFKAVSYSLNTTDQINLRTKENVNISFVWYYFPLLHTPLQTNSLSLATIEDIAADKTRTIGRRAVWRDYVDIYWLLQTKTLDLVTLIQLAKKKFKGEFDSSLFLEQLSYFDDVSIVPIEFFSTSPSSSEIQSFFKKEVKQYIANNL